MINSIEISKYKSLYPLFCRYTSLTQQPILDTVMTHLDESIIITKLYGIQRREGETKVFCVIKDYLGRASLVRDYNISEFTKECVDAQFDIACTKFFLADEIDIIKTKIKEQLIGVTVQQKNDGEIYKVADLVFGSDIIIMPPSSQSGSGILSDYIIVDTDQNK